MHTAKYLYQLAFGLVLALTSGWQLFIRWRRRRYFHRVPGVIVGRRGTRGEVGSGPNTSVRSRVAIFRFTTLDGQEIETESNAQTWPGPKPGKRVTVVYDPQQPYEAEITGRFVVIIVICIAVMVLGAIAVVNSLIHLL